MKYYYIVPFLLFLASCQINFKVTTPKENGIKGYHQKNIDSILKIASSNRERLDQFKSIYNSPNTSELKWGLAMSGGGVRSASVNIGALKALYDLDVLDSIDIISSVSGGSYALGWFYTNEIQNTSDRLGKNLFDGNAILQNICHLQNYANTMRTATMATTFFSSPKRAFSTYRNRISRTFISPTLEKYSLNKFQNKIIDNKIPFFIINTTVATKNNNDWLPSIFEYSPFYRGNQEIGYEQIDASKNIDIRDAIAISGAALKSKLLKKTTNYSEKINSDFIPLSDGGHSENLGAISLIRRAVKNIIIIDAEHNKDLSFDGYKELKTQLKNELQLELNVPSIDSFIYHKQINLLTSVHKGVIRPIYIQPNNISTPLEINIYYIKMALPNSILEKISDNQFLLNGAVINQTIEDSFCTGKNKNKSCNEYSCFKHINLSSDDDFEALSYYWVKSYSEWLNTKSKWRHFGYRFPHIPTSDQSYYRDQIAAFIGLGYIETLELKKLIIKQ